MEPELVGAEGADTPGDEALGKRVCDKCGSGDLSITPVPGFWLQYWCDSCDNWWWETREGKRLTADPPVTG